MELYLFNKNTLVKLIQKRNTSADFVKESYRIVDQKVWRKYTSNPEFPYLISFPRTGSHWLRNVMELYFEKPSLTRVFFYKKPKDFTCFHIHDEDLLFEEKRKVIYLYRDPVETIYSQMSFYNEDVRDEDRVKYWANKYGKHLEKWLLNDDLSIEKVVLTYEGLKTNFNQEFKKLCDFLNVPFDANKLKKTLSNTSKEKINNRVVDDQRVINSTSDYAKKRNLFIESRSELIIVTIEEVNSKLIKFI